MNLHKYCKYSSIRGFTLVELMVSIGIIAVLLGILLPVLGKASEAGRNTLLLANQRESMRVVEAYARDHGDRFPSAGNESRLTASWEWRGELFTIGWWQQPEYWGWYTQSLGYDGYVSLGPGATSGVFDERAGCTGCGLGTRSLHLLSPTTLAEPELFASASTGDSRSLHGAMRFADVRHPSLKGVLIQLYFVERVGDAEAESVYPIHFADGHGRRVVERDLRPGVTAPIPFGGLPVLSTADGVRGRDL